jgi:hypothetical protein
VDVRVAAMRANLGVHSTKEKDFVGWWPCLAGMCCKRNAA